MSTKVNIIVISMVVTVSLLLLFAFKSENFSLKKPKKINNSMKVIRKTPNKTPNKTPIKKIKRSVKKKSLNKSKADIAMKITQEYTTLAMDRLTKQNLKRLPNVARKVEEILGSEKFKGYMGEPQEITIDESILEFKGEPVSELVILDKLDTKPGFYPKIVNKDSERIISLKTLVKIFNILAIDYFKINNFDNLATNIGLIELIEGPRRFPVIFFPPEYEYPQISNNDWDSPREPRYNGSWEKTVVVNDSEIAGIGDDFYGIMSIGSNNSFNCRYVVAGNNDRSQLISMPQSDNLGFGRSDLTEAQGGPAVRFNRSLCSDSDREYGQGTKIGTYNGKTWTLFPIICDGDETKLDLRIGMDLRSSNHTIIVRNSRGDIANREGRISGACNWIAFDENTNCILAPNDYDSNNLNMYHVHKGVTGLTITYIRKIYLTGDNFVINNSISYKMDGAVIASDGKFYTAINNIGLQGIMVFRPFILRGELILLKEQFISLDVDDKLVGITEVDDVRYIKTANTPMFVVMEINEDYFTQDNVTLHEILPIDSVRRADGNDSDGTPGIGSETGNWRDLGDEFGCATGITLYTAQRAQNWNMTTRSEPLTFNSPELAGLKNWILLETNIGLSLDLERVEIYDNQCLSANYWNHDDGEDQITAAMCFGYTIYFAESIVQSDGTIRISTISSILHEICHTRQFVQLGESHYQFGCAYGESVLYGMLDTDESYYFSPMEVEAREFQARWIDLFISSNAESRYNLNLDPVFTSIYDFTSRTTCDP